MEIEIQTGLWKLIRPHWERGAVIVVSQDLALPDVAQHVVNDDTESVQEWIQKGELARPTDQDVLNWDQIDGKQFLFVIVQPYVLIQEKSH